MVRKKKKKDSSECVAKLHMTDIVYRKEDSIDLFSKDSKEWHGPKDQSKEKIAPIPTQMQDIRT